MERYKQKYENLTIPDHVRGMAEATRRLFDYAQGVSSLPQLETSRNQLEFIDKADHSAVRWRLAGERPFLTLNMSHNALFLLLCDQEYGRFSEQTLAISEQSTVLYGKTAIHDRFIDTDLTEINDQNCDTFEAFQQRFYTKVGEVGLRELVMPRLEIVYAAAS